MANILINDILDELREENNRLFNENKLIYQLLDKYRNFSLNFQKSCVCNQKSNDDFVVKSLEEEYQRIADKTGQYVIETDCSQQLSIVSIKTRSKRLRSKPNGNKKLKKCKTNEKNVTKALDITELFDANDCQLSDHSEEETDIDSVYGNEEREQTLQSMDQIISKGVVKRAKFQCDECPKSFPTESQLEEHGSVHEVVFDLNPNSIECEECHQKFASKRGLWRHKKTVHSSDGNVCKCDYCPFETTSKKYLITHLTGKHSKEKPFECLKCENRFMTRKQLRKHVSTHHKEPKDPKDPKDRQKYECDECHKLFFERWNVKFHKKFVHSLNPKLYECNYCGFKSKYEKSLKTHVEALHMITERTFECNDCHKLFKTRITLFGHKKLVHSGIQFPCDWPGCDQVYKRKVGLDLHKLTHLGIKDFKCDIEGCLKSFKTKRELKLHIDFHTKPNVCSWPGCDHRFGSIPLLASHMNRHQNIRPYECTVIGCGKAFFSEHNRRKHRIQVHKTNARN